MSSGNTGRDTEVAFLQEAIRILSEQVAYLKGRIRELEETSAKTYGGPYAEDSPEEARRAKRIEVIIRRITAEDPIPAAIWCEECGGFFPGSEGVFRFPQTPSGRECRLVCKTCDKLL